MTYINLKKIRYLLYFFTAATGLIQFLLSQSLIEFYCAVIMVVFNLILISYCFNEKYFFDYLISLNVIFISCTFSYTGALYLNTFEFTHLASRLTSPPIELFYLLSYFWLAVLFAHFIYRKSHTLIDVKKKLSNFFYKINIMEISNHQFLYFLTFVGLSAYLIIFFVTTLGSETVDKATFIDLLGGLRIFIYSPIILFFSTEFYNADKSIPKLKILFFAFVFVLVNSTAIGGRALFFNYILSFFLIFFISFQLGYRSINIFSVRFILVSFILVLSFEALELFSLNALKERKTRYEVSKQENIKYFFKNFNLKEIEEFKEQKTSWDGRTSEVIYGNSIFNRINYIYVHDLFYEIYKNLSEKDFDDFKKFFNGNIISIMPQPIIKIFNPDFVKEDYISFSIGSLLRNMYSFTTPLGRAVSSFPVVFKIYFGNYFPIALIVLSCVIFIISDSFYNKEKKSISPIFILCAIGFGGGLLDIFNLMVPKTVFVILRKIPQTIIIYFLLLKLFEFYFQKRTN